MAAMLDCRKEGISTPRLHKLGTVDVVAVVFSSMVCMAISCDNDNGNLWDSHCLLTGNYRPLISIVKSQLYNL